MELLVPLAGVNKNLADFKLGNISTKHKNSNLNMIDSHEGGSNYDMAPYM